MKKYLAVLTLVCLTSTMLLSAELKPNYKTSNPFPVTCAEVQNAYDLAVSGCAVGCSNCCWLAYFLAFEFLICTNPAPQPAR